ncbi:MAG: GNAT family N-acetyltransferase [Acidobacteriota bacterium]
MTRTVDVRTLAITDLESAFALSSASGWNQRLADWCMLLTLAPSGSFAAVGGGRIVGTAVAIDYGPFGWIAMMLVDPAWRGRGVGARLLEEAIRAVPNRKPIRLDATPLGRTLYRRHGFEDETTITRYVAVPSPHRGERKADQGLPAIRRMAAADLADVSAADEPVFGARRRGLLEWLLNGAPQYANVIERAGGAAYCFGRQGRLFDQIGPVVAANDASARALVGASLAAAGDRAVVVDAFDRGSRFTAWLRGCGFTAERPLFRMCRPGSDEAPVIEASGQSFRELAILGPELG